MYTSTTRHVFDEVHCRGGRILVVELVIQEFALHFHDLAIPIFSLEARLRR